MKLIIVLCEKSGESSHDICDKCPVHGVHVMFGIPLACSSPSDDVPQKLKALGKEFKEKPHKFQNIILRRKKV